MLSPAIEDYLKSIYKLQSAGGDGAGVSTSQIAAAMDVTPASASKMLKRLARMRLVDYTAYQGATLTSAGTDIAVEIIRHHRLLETYLREVMGYDWDQMHAEAEQLEHHISEDFEDRIDSLLGYPTHDPHGDPIPTRDGVFSETPCAPLTAKHVGQRVRVIRLADQDPERLRLLESAGLLPGNVVDIEVDVETDWLLARHGEASAHRIEPGIAHAVLVQRVERKSPTP